MTFDNRVKSRYYSNTNKQIRTYALRKQPRELINKVKLANMRNTKYTVTVKDKLINKVTLNKINKFVNSTLLNINNELGMILYKDILGINYIFMENGVLIIRYNILF